jgi:hypothetical protein
MISNTGFCELPEVEPLPKSYDFNPTVNSYNQVVNNEAVT